MSEFGKWEPIDTYKGCLGALVSAKGQYTMSAYRDAAGIWRVLGSKDNYTRLPYKPTHWTPLPPPPTE